MEKIKNLFFEMNRDYAEMNKGKVDGWFYLSLVAGLVLSPIILIGILYIEIHFFLEWKWIHFREKILEIKRRMSRKKRKFFRELKQFIRENITYKLRERRRIKRIRYVVPAPTISAIENAEPEESSIQTISWKERKGQVDAEYEDLGHSDQEEYRLGALDAGWEI